jgi:hypothetical protein
MNKKKPQLRKAPVVPRHSPCRNCGETIERCACMRNLCDKCGKPIGNITFAICDKCWDETM